MNHWRPRIQVFTFVVDPPAGSPVHDHFDDRAVPWLFDAHNPVGIPRYSADVSAGFIDLHATVMPVAIAPSIILRNQITHASRASAVQACLALADAAFGLDRTAHDGVVFVIRAASVNAGAIKLDEGRIRNGALLDANGSHSFMAHEVAHAIGFEHSFHAAAASATYPDGEYGSGYCLTSAENWGGSQPSSPLSVIPESGIDPSAAFWHRHGPGISAAATWRYSPGFARPSSYSSSASSTPDFVRVLRADAERESLSLVPPWRRGTSLIAVPDHEADGYLTVEYRPAGGWDATVGRRDGAPRPGLLIQRIADVPAMPEYGPGYAAPKRARVVEQHVIMGETADVDWTDGRIGVRLRGHDADSAHVVVGTTVRRRALRLVPRTTREVVRRTRTELVGTYFGGARCDRRAANLDQTDYRTTGVVEVAPFAFTDPKIIFHVAGERVEEGRARTIEVTLAVAVPTALEIGESSTVLMAPVRLHCEAVAGRLTVTSEGAPGSYAFDVDIFTADTSGDPMRSRHRFVFVDRALEFPDDIAREQEACVLALRGLGEKELPPVVVGPGEIAEGVREWGRLTLRERAAAFGLIDSRHRLAIRGLPVALRIDVPEITRLRRPRP